jgi:hypothetical protein
MDDAGGDKVVIGHPVHVGDDFAWLTDQHRKPIRSASSSK